MAGLPPKAWERMEQEAICEPDNQQDDPGPLSIQPTDSPLTITASGGVNADGADAIDSDSRPAWAISNAGTVSSASGYGVSLAGAGNSVTNNPGGSISGTGPAGFNIISGVAITGASGTVTNGGTISVSGGGYGVHLAGGGVVTNSGFITGGEDGVLIEAAPGRSTTPARSARVLMTAPLSLLAAQSPIAPPGRFGARSRGPSLRAFLSRWVPVTYKTTVLSSGINMGSFLRQEAASPTAQATHPPTSLADRSASLEQVSASCYR